jgi:metal-responsive CopG/Arc/MetJ family transcriptional regulator
MTVSLPSELLERIDDWAGRETTRSEAIRRLVELGLKSKGK